MSDNKADYQPEPYWSDVAKRISEREKSNIIAGDDEPFYRYKRKKFLNLLDTLDFSDKLVLEVGSGPGGNLGYIKKKGLAKEIVGADISNDMIELATKNTGLKIFKTNGEVLPFPDDHFDIVFTSTVLQHNTNHTTLKKLIAELARVSKDKVVLFERIENDLRGDELNQGRPISFYAKLLSKSKFKLHKSKSINILISYYVCGFARKVFSSKTRKEGEPLSKVSLLIQNITLPFTSKLDYLFNVNKDLVKLEFIKK